MKVRLGFVSNSSSASFVLQKRNLTKEQLNMVREHGFFGGLFLFFECKAEGIEHQKAVEAAKYIDYWDLEECNDTIGGDTCMDNFDMRWFLDKIGVSEDDYKMYGQNYGDWGEDDWDYL